MIEFSRELVRPLKDAQNEFLEVLLDRFDLRRTPRGATLSVRFDENANAVWLRSGKSHVEERIPGFASRRAVYQKKLEALLVRGELPEFSIRPEDDFPFRYVSGGVLPIVHFRGGDYYCLFYREIPPVGWNLANGGADSRHELLYPFQAAERELREELVVFDQNIEKWYPFEGTGRPLDRPEYAVARKLWHEKYGTTPTGDSDDLGDVLLPMKWVDGPDTLQVAIGPEDANTVHSCFLNVNAIDFGIEVDRAAKIRLDDPKAVICDGEIVRDKTGKDVLVDSVVGLFDPYEIHRAGFSDRHEFRPKMFFYGGRLYENPSELNALVENDFVPRMADTLAGWSRMQWDDTADKYDLCPVTRNIVARCSDMWEERPVQSTDYEVFVCFASDDVALAQRVRDFIAERTGKSVFFSPSSDHANFGKAIDGALTTAHSLVAVASDWRHLQRRWPEYEYRAMHVLSRAGKKSEDAVVSYIDGFLPGDLPLPLSYYHSVKHNPDNPEASLNELIPYIQRAASERPLLRR